MPSYSVRIISNENDAPAMHPNIFGVGNETKAVEKFLEDNEREVVDYIASGTTFTVRVISDRARDDKRVPKVSYYQVKRIPKWEIRKSY